MISAANGARSKKRSTTVRAFRGLATVCLLSGLGAGFSRDAVAQPSVPTVTTPPLPSVAITISPIHLVLPVVELTGEVRAGEKIGIALVAGAGKITDKDTKE